ncbi:hypothetical protein DF216_10600 [Streptococcus oralis]|uniref:Uncharacterized protein n=1 Tax=Streptococcus oralis TaxID=1303 RepID=A0A4Q2FDH4_STROR|nr:hypothetical protein DF216_10600 [Streptococcus oralis]
MCQGPEVGEKSSLDSRTDTISVAGEWQSHRAAEVGRGHIAEDIVNQGKGFKPYPKYTGQPLKGCKQENEVILFGFRRSLWLWSG